MVMRETDPIGKKGGNPWSLERHWQSIAVSVEFVRSKQLRSFEDCVSHSIVSILVFQSSNFPSMSVGFQHINSNLADLGHVLPVEFSVRIVFTPATFAG